MKSVLCLTALLVFAGAGRADDVTANDLKQIGLAYLNHIDDTRKAPGKAEDFAPYVENSKRLLGFLKDKDIEFVYKVHVKEMTDGASNTALAWVKDVPKSGGWVLFGDGAVKKLTADEFAKTTKAKAK